MIFIFHKLSNTFSVPNDEYMNICINVVVCKINNNLSYRIGKIKVNIVNTYFFLMMDMRHEISLYLLFRNSVFIYT
jgi:hypothetical protein